MALATSTSSAVVNDIVICSFSTFDTFGNLDTSVSGQVRLDLTLGSTTVSETITIASGEGSYNFQKTVSGTYQLSLTDSFALGLDVSATKQIVLAHGLVCSC